MDGVSTAIGLIVNGYKAFKYVQKAVEDLKGASKELQALRERLEDIEFLVEELQSRNLDDLFQTDRDKAVLERHGRRAQDYFNDAIRFMREMEKTGDDGDQSVKRIRWLRKGKKLDDLNEKLDKLENSLKSVLEIVLSRSQAREEQFRSSSITILQSVHRGVDTLTQRIDTRLLQPTVMDMDSVQDTTGFRHTARRLNANQEAALVSVAHPQDSSVSARVEHRSAPDCCCYTSSTQSVVPSMLEPIFGQVTTLEHKCRVLSRRCKCPTCRRRGQNFIWHPPEWLMLFKSIYATRLVPPDAEVWSVVWRGDLIRLQSLFEKNAASIYDMDEDGITLLHSACFWWGIERSEESQKIVKFLADAGADLDSNPDSKKVLFNASLITIVNNPTDTFAHRIQTDPLSISICQSVFGIDFSDLAIDVLEQMSDGKELQAALGFLTPSDTLDSSLDVASLFQQLIGWTLLDYAIFHMTPKDVLQLLQNGADASQGAPMALAACRGYDDLLQPLLEAGAYINAIDVFGLSALHWACYYGRLDTLQILVSLAGDKINWHARTRDGKNRNALQLAKASVCWDFDWKPTSWRKEALALLRERGLKDENEDEDAPLRIPGGLD